ALSFNGVALTIPDSDPSDDLISGVRLPMDLASGTYTFSLTSDGQTYTKDVSYTQTHPYALPSEGLIDPESLFGNPQKYSPGSYMRVVSDFSTDYIQQTDWA